MKPVSTDLQTHLNTGATTLCTAWRIIRKDGQEFGFTDHDKPLQFDSITFEPDSGFSGAQISADATLSVDAQEAEGVLKSTQITETDIIDGRWDNADVEVWRLNWADPVQRILLRRGSIGQIRRGKLAFVAEIRSLSHLLTQTGGRSFQPNCDARLGGGRCGVDLDDPAYKGSGSVQQLQRDRAFTVSGLSGFAHDLFSNGILQWSSGASAGRESIIIEHRKVGAVVTFTLADAPLLPILALDDFVVRAGCDKRIETCSAKFNNAIHHRGFAQMISSDNVLRAARSDGDNSGGVL